MNQDEEGATFIAADRFAALSEQGWIDTWRAKHGSKREFSWFSAKGNGFRVDHAFASPSLAPRIVSVEYVHSSREGVAAPSDHSALTLEIDSG